MISTTLLLAASVVVGQARDTSSHPELKGLEPLIGSWKYEGTLHDDVPGLAEKGAEITAVNTFRWILRGKAIQLDWSTKIDGQLAGTGRALLGWDGTTNKIMEWALTDKGNHSGQWKRQGDQWIYTSAGMGPEGKTAASIVYTDIGSDSYTFQARDRVYGEAKLPDMKTYVFKRVENPPRKGKKK